MNNRQDIALGLLRLGVGVMFIAHGLLKLLVFGLDGAAQFFGAVGFPAWSAYPVTFFEIIGGVLLVLGVYTRVVAWIGVPVLIGALTVHAGNGWVFSNQGGGWEYPAFLVLTAVIVAIGGPGKWALTDK